MKLLQATTAMFPGMSLQPALDAIFQGVREPLGKVGTEHIQLCPQTPTALTESLCEQLRDAYPSTRFRTHANARALPGLHLFDLSRYNESTRPYFVELADRARRLRSPAVSMHAGYRRDATLAQMLDNRARIQELFGDIPVAVEGLFPNAQRPQLVDCWADYEALLDAGVPLAVDVSHLHIIASKHGDEQRDLTRALLGSYNTYEIHLSTNDGERDQHAISDASPWWLTLLHEAKGPNAVVFTEGNHTSRLRGRSSSSIHSSGARS